MKILHRDLKRGTVKVLPENLDDLWHLFNLIYSGDRVLAKTTREVKMEEGGQQTEGRRVPMFLGVQVEKVNFQRETNRLRVTGVVFEAPERYGIKGAHHTIAISVDRPVTIQKEEWLDHELERLRVASDEKAPPIIVVAIDDRECSIALLRHSGFDIKVDIRAKLPGKIDPDRREEAKTGFFGSCASSLRLLWAENHTLIAIVGPGYMKDELARYLDQKVPELSASVASVASASSGGVAGLYEALRSGVLANVAKRVRAIDETRVVEEVFSRLGAGRGNVSYGLEDVAQAAEYGAIEIMLVSDSKLSAVSHDERRQMEDLMRNVERKRGRVMVISTLHEAGEKLFSLGGVAALLRFQIQ